MTTSDPVVVRRNARAAWVLGAALTVGWVGLLGLVDITHPAQPRPLPSVDVRFMGVGEPTSVAISPDGRFVVVALG